MLKNSINNEQDNDWALDQTDEPIHISQAESGAKGYFCMGCNKEMQAVKMKNPKHQSYFRHHTKDVDHSKEECVHSSREYRERLAYFYFMRVKQIKVPPVYKYPAKIEDGQPMLIAEATTITAHSIERELTFYEDENGEIKWGKNPKVEERYLLIRPDAVFFNKNKKPILFLEFVITHKPDINKLNKLRRLGINTVQIIVPKLNEEELEKEISKASRVKWTYHEIESNTEYVSVPYGNSEGVLSIDEEQRKLFEESYNCRAAQIGNLIRAITRCLESQSYSRTQFLFEQEISRIENATIDHQSRLDEIQRGIEEEIFGELEPRRNELEQAEREFHKNYNNLEERYYSKRKQLIEEQAITDRELQRRYRFSSTGEELRRKFTYLEEEIAAEERGYLYEEERIDVEIKTYNEFEINFGRRQEELKREFEQLEEELKQEFERYKKDEQLNFRNSEEAIRIDANEYRKLQSDEESRIRSDFEREYEQVIKRVSNRDIQKGDELSARIKTILELRRLLDRYSNGKNTLERYRKGIEHIKLGTWKTWNR